ncbi:MAG: protein translocase SEC61 complex subunit gamma, partial [Candidatus Marsarchaeota archaeon]|nr:protein translocase SEC61 complex subunit gamma [Candidatus Marsarchaeota archaeon]
MSNIKNFISNARHILYVSYKPNEQRFKRTAKIIILGIVLIGVIGFI